MTATMRAVVLDAPGPPQALVIRAAGAPDAWRRHLGLLLDGFRAERAHPLPQPPLSPRQVHRAMVTLGRRSADDTH
jgi:hypothetical protein